LSGSERYGGVVSVSEDANCHMRQQGAVCRDHPLNGTLRVDNKRDEAEERESGNPFPGRVDASFPAHDEYHDHQHVRQHWETHRRTFFVEDHDDDYSYTILFFTDLPILAHILLTMSYPAQPHCGFQRDVPFIFWVLCHLTWGQNVHDHVRVGRLQPTVWYLTAC